MSIGMRVLLLKAIMMLSVVSIDAAKLRLSIDKGMVRPGEPVELRMSFIDVGEQPRLRTPDFQNFQVASTSTQTAFRFDNGRQTSEFTYTFELVPTKVGLLPIGPFQVEIGGETLTSNQVKVEVSKSAAPPKNSSGVELKAWFDKKAVYSGQQVNYIMEFWRSSQGPKTSQPKFSIPEFSDFIVEQDQARQDEREEVKEGELYLVTKVSVPMIAVKQGDFEFSSGMATYSVAQRRRRRNDLFSVFDMSPFSMGRPKKAYGPSVNISVSPLPDPKPESFDGLVGQFVIDANLDKTVIDTGGSITLELKLTGVGNLQDWQMPSLDIKGFKVYEDGQAQLDRKRTVNGELGGIKTYKYALVPQGAGTFTIKSQDLHFFNPAKRSYELVSTKELMIKVNPGKQREKVFVSSGQGDVVDAQEKKKVKRLSKDVMPILTDYYEGNVSQTSRKFWFLLSVLLPILCLLLDRVMIWWLARQADPIEIAYREAFQIFKNEIEEAELMSSTLSTFLLRKLRIETREVTPQELQVLMKDSPLTQELQDKVILSLQREEQSRYTGGSHAISQDYWYGLAKEIQSQV